MSISSIDYKSCTCIIIASLWYRFLILFGIDKRGFGVDRFGFDEPKYLRRFRKMNGVDMGLKIEYIHFVVSYTNPLDISITKCIIISFDEMYKHNFLYLYVESFISKC